MKHLIDAYTPLPFKVIKGKGVWLWDASGRRYLDLIAGMGVTILGHSHPEIVATICSQSKKVLHLSNLVTIPQQLRLANLLAKVAKLAVEQQQHPVKMFFTNSGAEAIETAIKLTRLYATSKNIVDPKIVVMRNAYHGRTMAALSASDNPVFKNGFEPLLDSFIRVEFNHLESLDALTKSNHAAKIVAILLEPIQGEGGVNLPSTNYLAKIREICDLNGWLMILDEVQTGLGRTGKMFCYQWEQITPDLLVLAKGLANGIPIGACLIKQPWADLFKPKSHGSTFGGNPLACTTAIKTLEIMKRDHLLSKVKNLGNYFKSQLIKNLAHNPKIKAIRGKGLMIGIELQQEDPTLMLQGLKHGILFNVTRGKVIRILPPYIITPAEIDLAVKMLNLVIA